MQFRTRLSRSSLPTRTRQDAAHQPTSRRTRRLKFIMENPDAQRGKVRTKELRLAIQRA